MKMELQDFLMFSYFGVTEKEATDMEHGDIIYTCADRAYLDLSRTLYFNKELANTDKEKEKIGKAFRNDICIFLREEIDGLLNVTSKGDFNKKHNELCEKLISKINKYTQDEKKVLITKKNETEIFYYGQAQKWINMTLKYLWLLGKTPKLNEEWLHIPIDSYILKAVSKHNQSNDKKVEIPNKNRETEGIYKYNDQSLKWSKWNGNIYERFQEEVKNNISNKPIEWEGPEWIKIAKEQR